MKWPIYCLTDNIVEGLMFSLIEQLFDNRMSVINLLNDDFYYLPFNGDQRLISG